MYIYSDNLKNGIEVHGFEKIQNWVERNIENLVNMAEDENWKANENITVDCNANYFHDEDEEQPKFAIYELVYQFNELRFLFDVQIGCRTEKPELDDFRLIEVLFEDIYIPDIE